MNQPDRTTRGSDNFLADLGIKNAEELSAKLSLAVSLNRIINDKPLTQNDPSELLGIPQPKVSALRNYKLDGFSVERLMNFPTLLDRDIEIRIKKKPPSRSERRIVDAGAG